MEITLFNLKAEKKQL